MVAQNINFTTLNCWMCKMAWKVEPQEGPAAIKLRVTNDLELNNGNSMLHWNDSMMDGSKELSQTLDAASPTPQTNKYHGIC